MDRKVFELSDLWNENATADHVQDYNDLLGTLLMNRMGGVAYHVALKTGALSKFPKEFKNTLRMVHKSYLEKYEKHRQNMRFLTKVFQDASVPHSFLKGTYLSLKTYPAGTRVSNDYDILIDQKDITAIQEILLQNGFEQGHYSETYGFMKSSRAEIIRARTQFGQTIPFFKEQDGNGILMDLNFSLDYKAKQEDDIIKKMLDARVRVDVDNDISFYTLDPADFVIHLCCHLFKEATTYNWLENNTDLSLYKFSDFNVYLVQNGNPEFFEKLKNRICEFQLNNVCYYAFKNSAVLFPGMDGIEGFQEFLDEIKPENVDFMNEIIWPAEKKKYRFHMDFKEWFQCSNRLAQLEEIL